ncbi:uncharacterized protein LOC107469175 [Arachis duranensis]|uniref:Uncharacterized protein LOC107469175 n=1 Tax=Arachis duranensis TaxID=130453 RepID=A0A6P4BVY1_ARADU|nr:uncharacterized protein LOC107469175 [Arachis duranensis]
MKYKVRLVAKGNHQMEGISFDQVFAPVIKLPTIRIILTIVLFYKWQIKQLDFNNAFLNGDLTELVYMKQPPSFQQGDNLQVCQLHKSLYGLKQAPKSWFLKLAATLAKFGFTKTRSNHCLFMKHSGDLKLYILVYVDDILITGNDSQDIQSIWWGEMESDSEDSSEFSGQWIDGWSTRSEDDKCERIGTESRQPEKVNMTSLDTEKTSRVADDAKAQESSPSMVRSNEEPNSSNRFVAGVTVEDLALAEFDSVEEAHARYMEYARVTGFAIRKGDSEKDKEGNIVRKFFFCNREGLRDKKHFERIDRQRAHKPITRTNCNAKFVVHLAKGCGK